MINFWLGFEKAATFGGVKSLKPPGQDGTMVSNKPTAMVATQGAFKPNPLPTPKPVSPTLNTGAVIPK